MRRRSIFFPLNPPVFAQFSGMFNGSPVREIRQIYKTELLEVTISIAAKAKFSTRKEQGGFIVAD